MSDGVCPNLFFAAGQCLVMALVSVNCFAGSTDSALLHLSLLTLSLGSSCLDLGAVAWVLVIHLV